LHEPHSQGLSSSHPLDGRGETLGMRSNFHCCTTLKNSSNRPIPPGDRKMRYPGNEVEFAPVYHIEKHQQYNNNQ